MAKATMDMVDRMVNDRVAAGTNFRVCEGWKGIFYRCNTCNKMVKENATSARRMVAHQCKEVPK